MPKLKAKAQLPSWDDWKVGAHTSRLQPSTSRPAAVYKSVNAALTRRTRARGCPRAPSRSRPPAASRLGWRCASRGRRSWRRTRSPTGVRRHRRDSRLNRAGECHPAPARPLRGLPRGPLVPGGLRRAAPHGPRQGRGPPHADAAPRHLAARPRRQGRRSRALACLKPGATAALAA